MTMILGLDVGSNKVRGALVRTSLRRIEVLRFLESDVHPLGEDGSLKAAQRLAVDDLMERLQSRPEMVLSAVGGDKVSLRRVGIPMAAAKRASDVLPFELEPYLPFATEDAIIDHQTITEADGELHLLTVATPRELIEEELASARALGFDPRELSVAPVALEGLASFLRSGTEAPEDDGVQEEGPALVIRVEGQQTDLCMLAEGRCALARTASEGTDTIHERPEAMQRAIRQTFAKFRSEGGAKPVRAWVCGDCADDPEMVAWFGKLTGLPTEAVPMPLAGAAGPTQAGEEGPPGHALALALAARHAQRDRRINLRQGDLAKADEAGVIRQHAGLLTVCIIAIAMTFGFSMLARYRTLVAEQQSLTEELEEVSERRLGKATRSPRAARKLLKRGNGKSDPMPDFDAFAALDAISTSIASEITHDVRKLKVNLDETGKGGSFQLQGSIPDVKSRDLIADKLAEHDCIFDVEKGQTTSIPGKDRTNYSLQGKLGCPGSPAREKPRNGKKKAKKKRSKR